MNNIELNRCCERVSIPGIWFGSKQCEKKAKVMREGKPYCTIHDPIRIKQKREEREKLFNDSYERNKEEFERRVLEQEYCKGLTNEQLKLKKKC